MPERDQAVMEQIQERLKNVQKIVSKDLKSEHTKCGGTINKINKLHDKLAKQKQEEGKLQISTQNQQKLMTLYGTAIEEAQAEEKVIRQALEKIYEIHAIRNERRLQVKSGGKEAIRRGALMKALHTWQLPLWMGNIGEKPPPLCGAIPAESNYVAPVRDMVAALQKSSEGDDNWILAEVISYTAATGKYEVDDIDEDQKGRFTLSRRRVIPLPKMRANPDTNPEALFKKDTIVMALYPQTTCFYKGIVKSLPVTPNDEYDILFEDSAYPEGYSPPLKVAQRYVIAIRDKKSKLKATKIQ